MPGRPKARPRFSDDWLTAVLDSLSEGVVAIDGAGLVTAANPAAELLLGFSIDERRFTPWTSLGLERLRLEDGERADPHPIERALLHDAPTPATPVTIDGDPSRWLELATHVLDPVAGAGTGVVVALRDITGRIHAQRDRERVLSVLRDVLAMTSHDLRGPIFTIRGYADLLTGLVPAEDPQLTNGLAAIRRQVDHLSRLVVDLSLTARLETGGILAETERVAVDVIVHDALQTASVQEVRTDVPDDLHVLLDPDHARRILVNLLENAAKYGHPPIELAAVAVEGAVEVTVTDAGTGVPDELVPVLFERFTRARGSQADGTGLGLAIVASLAELNGGSVRYEPTGHAGARFVVRLPLAPASTGGSPHAGRFGGSDDEGPLP